MLVAMSFFNRSAAIVASTALFAVLSACSGGDGPDSDYCKDLEAAKPSLASLKNNGAEQLQDVFKVTHKLSDEAPSDVKDAWETYDEAISNIEKALEDAGVGPKELVALQRGEVPDGVDQEKLRGLPATFQKLDSPAVAKASNQIATHAKEVCKLSFVS
jgi:hypothetical protein